MTMPLLFLPSRSYQSEGIIYLKPIELIVTCRFVLPENVVNMDHGCIFLSVSRPWRRGGKQGICPFVCIGIATEETATPKWFIINHDIISKPSRV